MNSMRHRYILLVALLLVQLAIAGTTGKLAGRVTAKETGEPLIGANVMIEGTPLGAATDLDGNYYILQIPPGSYSVRFSMIGYQTLVINEVRIKIDLTTTIDDALAESVLGMEEIVVQAERPMIQTDVTYSQASISSDELEMLPVEEFEDVIALQAGVVKTNGEIHVRGGRGGEIAYMIDGITVTDPFNSDIAVEIENNAIQELQFISGTFNAEYGQAMSAIVNIVTKDGSFSDYLGSVSRNMGGYYSVDTDIFPNINSLNLGSISDIKGNIEGPLLSGKISFFASGRYKKDQGHLYGQRIFYPDSYIWADAENIWVIDTLLGIGDGTVPAADDTLKNVLDSLRNQDAFDWVPMNWSEEKTALVKLSWRVTPTMKLSFNRMFSDTRSQSYSHVFKWNPDGAPHAFSTRIGDLLKLDISLSQSTFASVMFSHAVNHYRSHLSSASDTDLSNVLDSNLYIVDPRIFDYTPDNNFYVGGQSMYYYNRESDINTYKIELTSQVNRKHQVKSGIEYRKTNISLNDLTVQYNDNTGFQPTYHNPIFATTHDSYGDEGRTPEEFSVYIQDKLESDEMIMNMGLRFDYFDPNWKVINDPEDPNHRFPLKPINKYFDLDGDGEISDDEMTDDNLKNDEDRLASNGNGDPWYRYIDPKTQLSPRFALAFPITDKSYMHFSYGHFFQNPSFSYIYDNPEFEVPAGSGINSTMGNADMEPQRTTQYEVGFSQQIGQDIGIEITGYFKDIRNLNSTKILKSFVAGDRYGQYVNKDHANSRGITLALSKRPLQKFSGNIDYTFSISEGNASDPTAAFYDEQSSIEPEKMLVPLDWDQRHTLNGTMTYQPTNNSGISFIVNYGSGFPYTTQFVGIRTSFENNALKPSTFNVALRSFYNFVVMNKYLISAHINVYNLFDIRNELTVYSDTGRATYSLVRTYTPQYTGPGFNSLDEYQVRPDYYSAPRQIKIGFSLSLK